MSDTSTLIAIKYKGQMIGIPQDSSVSWNDLEDKPTTKTQIGVDVYEDRQGQPVSLYYEQYGNNELDYAIRTTVSKGYFEFYVNPGFVYYDATYTDGNGNTLSLTEEQKKYLVMYCYENGQYRSKIILYLPYNGSEPTSEDVLKVLIDSEDIEDVNISLNNYSSPYYGGGKFNVQMYPTFKGSTTINDLYTQTDTNKSWKVGVLDKVYSEMFDSSVIDAYTKAEADNKFALDTSVSELWDTSAGPDLSDYYTKTQIDTSIANNYASKNDISAFITSNDISTKLEANDVSLFTTTDDVSNLITLKVGIFKITGSTSNKQGYTDNPDSSFGDEIGTNGFIIGNNRARGINSFSVGYLCDSLGPYSFTANNRTYSYGSYGAAFGSYTRALGTASFASGERTEVNNSNEAGFGAYNDSSKNSEISINTLFSVGNGGYFNGSTKKHNALEIKKNGDVYIPDTDDTANANYYEKPMRRLQDLFALDTSIANNYASKNDISTFITSNDVSIYLTDNDISTFITANDISTKLEANDVSLFITANDVSIYSTNTYVNSTFAKISYISLSDYDNLQVKDPSTLYIIPS